MNWSYSEGELRESGFNLTVRCVKAGKRLNSKGKEKCWGEGPSMYNSFNVLPNNPTPLNNVEPSDSKS